MQQLPKISGKKEIIGRVYGLKRTTNFNQLKIGVWPTPKKNKRPKLKKIKPKLTKASRKSLDNNFIIRNKQTYFRKAQNYLSQEKKINNSNLPSNSKPRNPIGASLRKIQKHPNALQKLTPNASISKIDLDHSKPQHNKERKRIALSLIHI